MKALKFITNINCENCLKSVTPFLNELESIEEWRVDIDHINKILTVESDSGDREEVRDTVKKAGFEIRDAE